MRWAGVHWLESFAVFFSIAAFSSAVDSSSSSLFSASLMDSRHSEIVSINLIAIMIMGMPKISTAKINNKRNEPDVSMRATLNWRGSFAEIGGEAPTTSPPMIIARWSIPFYYGLCDADERDQTYNRQNLYEYGIQQPHNLLLWRE